MKLKSVGNLLQRTVLSWNDHDAPRLGAALAFYTILSLAPLLVIILPIIALAFGHSSAQDQILSQVQGMVGKGGSDAVQMIIDHAPQPASGIFAWTASGLTLLFGASGVFVELRSALNTIWDVTAHSGIGVRALLKERLFSFAMVLAIGFLLLVSLVLSAGLAAVGKFLGGMLPVPEFFLGMINFVVSLAGVSILFALIFRFVPDIRVEWTDVWIGAIATGFLFTIGKSVIGLYLGKAVLASEYGAAGSLMVMVVWIYYSSMLFFFGAEFTHMLAKTNHPPDPPAEAPES